MSELALAVSIAAAGYLAWFIWFAWHDQPAPVDDQRVPSVEICEVVCRDADCLSLLSRTSGDRLWHCSRGHCWTQRGGLFERHHEGDRIVPDGWIDEEVSNG